MPLSVALAMSTCRVRATSSGPPFAAGRPLFVGTKRTVAPSAAMRLASAEKLESLQMMMPNVRASPRGKQGLAARLVHRPIDGGMQLAVHPDDRPSMADRGRVMEPARVRSLSEADNGRHVALLRGASVTSIRPVGIANAAGSSP
jgi:hypothetical protein